MASLTTPTSIFIMLATRTDTEAPTCTTAIPDHYGYVPPDACNANYGFYPSWEWNLVFAVLFGFTTLAHIIQAIVFKKSFCWVIVMGSLWECVCFVLRTLGAHDQQNSTYMIVSTIFFLLAPLWINAFIYMTVARLVYFTLPDRKILNVPAGWLAKGFVIGDIISFIIQAAGGSMLANDEDETSSALGQKLYMGGIGIQLGFVIVFVVFTVAFYYRLIVLVRTGGSKRPQTWIRGLLWATLAVLLLILIRIIFRLIEFSQGFSDSNTFLNHEAYALLLDGLPMFLALLLLNAIHPGLALKGPESSFPSNIPNKWRRKQINKKPDSFSGTELLDSTDIEMNER